MKQQQGGVMWPNTKQISCYHLDIDYFSTAAYPKVFYSTYTTAVTNNANCFYFVKKTWLFVVTNPVKTGWKQLFPRPPLFFSC